MPQDGLKSAVYRSFITCEDPKGVVDCGMIMRRSKSSGGSQIMDKQKKVEIRRNSKNSSSRSSSLEMIPPEKFQNSSSSSSSFQIMEVSRGAQRLNHMIDSWSNENNRFDHGQSKDIAKDLLKGALDLQESLVMLGKLQEASQYMSNLNKKHLGNPQRAYLNRHGDQDYVNPRLSSDGYISRNSNEGLKKVIRDSLVRQKFLEDTSTAGKGSAYSPRRFRESYSENSPSTSSSQSSMHHNTSEYSSVSSQKAKGPSLIAKLMGIEEYPLYSLQESEKISNPQRPSFEIDRPKVRKPQTASQSVDPEKRTLKEVLDTMRFKGLLRNNSFEEPKFDIQHFNHLELEKRFTGDSPPIVLIKPISAESETEAKAPIVRGEEAFYNRRMVKKLRSKGEVSPKTMIAKEEALKSDKVKQKLEVEETPIRKTGKGGARNHRGEVDKHGEKEAEMKETVARQSKASQPVDKKPQEKESIDKRVDKIQNKAADNRKSAANDIVKAKTVSKTKSQDQDIVTSAKARKPESGSNITKSRVFRQPSNLIITSSKHSTTQNAERTSTVRRRNQLRKENPIKEPTRESITKNVVSEEIIRRTVINDTSESPLISFNTDPAVHLSIEEEKETYGCQSEGRCISFQSFPSEATSLSSMQETNPESAEITEEETSQSGKNEKTVESSENLGEILLSNASFLSHALEFFDLDVNDSIIFQTPCVSNSGMCRTRLALDCASELVECKSFQLSQTVSPLSLTLQGKLIVGLSVDKLVADVCNDIENLRSYSKLFGENLIADSLYSMLERDVMCKGVGKGTWDLGWRNGFTGDEAEQVVSDIERLIFNALIEEVFA